MARTSNLPVIRREGINWRGGVGGEALVLDLEFENPGAEPTIPTLATVGLAPFGAFVLSQPVTAVLVPSIPPGQRVTVTTTDEHRTEQQADLAMVFARRLARTGPRTLWPEVTSLDTTLAKIAAMPPSRLLPVHGVTGAPLTALHFVGNLDVFVDDRRPVERHMNRSIGLRPCCGNLVCFMIGDGRRDNYTLRLDAPPEWTVTLDGCRWNEPFEASREWIDALITPPSAATHGQISIWVTRASSGQEVPIEFELAADAQTLACGRNRPM